MPSASRTSSRNKSSRRTRSGDVPTQEKVESVEALKERLGTAKSAVLTEYRGLSVQQMSDLRKQLKGASAEYKVVKNRLARLAVKGSALDALGTHLKGPTGLVFTKQDPVAVAKALKALADLPSKEQLRSQIVGAVQGPMAQLVSLLQAPLRELVYVLDARGKGAAESA